jgi:hypothetical protein
MPWPEEQARLTQEARPTCLPSGALATQPLSTPIPAYDSACHDGQSSSTGGTYYRLADDRNDVEAPQRWDQELKDFCAYNTAYSSRNQVLDGS